MYTYIYTYIDICIYICICIYLCTYTHIYMFIYVVLQCYILFSTNGLVQHNQHQEICQLKREGHKYKK
jgi:hypothetical protein